MKCNWRDCTLGDLITFQRGHDLSKKQMTDGKYPVIGSNGIIGYHDQYTTEAPSQLVEAEMLELRLFFMDGPGRIIQLCM